MKNLNIFLFFMFSLGISVICVAQKGKTAPAYIIHEDGTKEEGKIILGSITDHEVKIKFITQKGKKQQYKAKSLLAYGYEATEKDDLGKPYKKWKHYEQQQADYPPKPFAETTVFMDREVEGTHNLYCYYIEQRTNVEEPYKYIYYIKSGDKTLVKVEEKDFLKFSRSFFADYPAMLKGLGKKHFKYINLNRMVRDYNYFLQNGHDKEVYKMAPESYYNSSGEK